MLIQSLSPFDMSVAPGDVEEPIPDRRVQVVKWVYTKWTEGKDLFPVEMCKYRVEGREIAPGTGRVHWQCFVILKEKQRFTEILARDQALGGQPSYFRPAKAQPWHAGKKLLAARLCRRVFNF